MEISNNIQEMQPVSAKSLGFKAIFEDGSQVDATEDVDAMGVTIRLGVIGESGEWDEGEGEGMVRIGWHALQAVADELNEMLRQARKADWL